MEYVLGVDGGATKTSCAIASTDGQIVSKGESGPSNYHVVGVRKAKEHISSAAKAALRSARLKLNKFNVACFGMAGLDCPSDEKTIAHFIEELRLSEKNVVAHDSQIALYGATLGGPGIVLIAGTGSVVAGKNREGTFVRTGNWGHLIGDQGSAYDIGRRAMVATMRAHDGRGPRTILVKEIKRFLDLPVMEEIMDRVYIKQMSPTEVASIAPLVVRSAKKGDKVATDILVSAGRELAAMVVAVVRRLGMEREEFGVATTGGVFRSGDIVLKPLEEEILKVAPRAKIVAPKFEPFVGAAILALEEAGERIDERKIAASLESVSRTRGSV